MVDFAAIEKKWQDLWEKEGVFQVSVKKNKKKFFLTVPYPYTSGPLHIGHGRSYTIGDILARYYRMLGYNVLFPMAAHVSGTPVASISKRIEEGDKKTIQLYREYVSLYEKDPEKVKEILESFKEPENVANFFAERIKNDLKLLGCSIDWRRFFRTNERYYNRFVEWQFKKLNSKGLLKQGSYPILYCLSCENAVGEDDIKGGDEIKASVMELQLIKFELEEEEGTYLVASTLRAETIFGVTNLWVNPKDELVKIQIESEKWLVSEASLIKLEKQGRDFKVLEKVQARGLIGKYVKSPIEGRKLLILPADFVDPDFGTGVVYSVPSHAPYDWVALREFRENKTYEEYGIPEDEVLNIAPISLIRVPNFGEHPAIEICEKMGIRSQKETEKLEEATQTLYREEYYNGVLKEICGQFAGMKVAEAKEEVFKFLEQRGLATRMYEVSALEKPVRCRCGGKVIVAVLKDQWFLDYKRKEWKELARRCLSKMKIVPEVYRKVFEDTIEWLHERPCARKRGLGTRLPFDRRWMIESLSDSTIYMAFYTIIHLLRKHNIDPERLDEDFFDFIFLNKGELVDVAEKLEVRKEVLNKIKEEFEYWYPVDLRHTGTAHLQNHLTFYIFHHAAIFPEKYWPRAISLNEMLISEGRKMSKSYGNVIPLVELPKEFSIDAFRLYIGYAADLKSTLDFRRKELESLHPKLEKLFNLIKNSKKGKFKKTIVIKKFLSRFYKNLKIAREVMESLSIRDYIQLVFFNNFQEVSYLERRVEKEDLPKVIGFVAEDWLKMLAPVMPHLAEELWHQLGHKSFISLEKIPTKVEKYFDEEAELAESIVEEVNEDLRELRKLVKIENPRKAYLIVAEEWKYKLIDEAINEFKEKGKVNWSTLAEKFRGKDVGSIIKKFSDLSKLPKKVILRNLELKALREAKSFLEKEHKLKIEILKEEKCKLEKAKKALPMKPAILIE